MWRVCQGELMAETVLVTGAFGLVGRDTVKRLAADGWHVVATMHRTVAGPLPPNVETRQVDLADPGAASQLVAEVAPAAIVHLAAVIPPHIYRDAMTARRVNVDATAALVKAAQSQPIPPRFLQASSCSIHGSQNPHRTSDLLTADTPAHPCELYGRHKLRAEQLVRSSNLNWTVLRLGGVLSADPSAVPFTADTLYFAGLLPVDGLVHTVDTRDIAAAFAAALRTDLPNEILLIGGDDTHRVRHGDIMQAAAAASGLSRLPAGRPGNPACDADWYVGNGWMDVTRAQELLQFQHHSFQDVFDELRFNFGWRRYPTMVVAPAVRALVKRRSPYRNTPGQYADVWGAIRARFGDPDPPVPADV
jgi:nucleoside-diphosphate-sugar epimerase